MSLNQPDVSDCWMERIVAYWQTIMELYQNTYQLLSLMNQKNWLILKIHNMQVPYWGMFLKRIQSDSHI